MSRLPRDLVSFSTVLGLLGADLPGVFRFFGGQLTRLNVEEPETVARRSRLTAISAVEWVLRHGRIVR
jgi:hypothetical protein